MALAQSGRKQLIQNQVTTPDIRDSQSGSVLLPWQWGSCAVLESLEKYEISVLDLDVYGISDFVQMFGHSKSNWIFSRTCDPPRWSCTIVTSCELH